MPQCPKVIRDSSRFWAWVFVGVYSGIIFFLSSLPAERLEVGIDFPNADKLFHFIEYFILGILVSRAFSKTSRPGFFNSLRTDVFVVVLFSLSDELHQLGVPGRMFSFMDLGADFFGAGLGSFLYRWRR